MNKEKYGIYKYNGILFGLTKRINPAICNNIDEHGEHYAK